MSFRDDLAGIPEQLEAPLHLTGALLPGHGRLLLGGMGGSAAAADFFQLYMKGHREALVLREAALPSEVGDDVALVVVSYSGETEESLALWDEGRAKGLARGVVASGGALLEAARKESCPHVVLPQGLAPRNAIGHLFSGINVLTGAALDDLRPEAARHLRFVREHVASGLSPVPEIAELLEDSTLPVLLAGDAYTLCAARRWRASLAENAKVPATIWEFPEAAHNRIATAGRDGPRRQLLGLLALGTPADAHARRRWDAVLAAMEAHGAKPLRVTLPHRVPWIEALGLAYLGDWMSLELAERLGVDPEPLAIMTDLKSRLRKGKDTAS